VGDRNRSIGLNLVHDDDDDDDDDFLQLVDGALLRRTALTLTVTVLFSCRTYRTSERFMN
jgi:hypothetical protein